MGVWRKDNFVIKLLGVNKELLFRELFGDLFYILWRYGVFFIEGKEI